MGSMIGLIKGDIRGLDYSTSSLEASQHPGQHSNLLIVGTRTLQIRNPKTCAATRHS